MLSIIACPAGQWNEQCMNNSATVRLQYEALSENKENDEYFTKARAIRGKNTQESFRIPSGFNEEAIRIGRNSQNFRLFRYAQHKMVKFIGFPVISRKKAHFR